VPSERPYEIVVEDLARASLKRLDGPVREQVTQAIRRLGDNPHPGQARLRIGLDGVWRVRSGSWRILYRAEVSRERRRVVVLDLAHRSTIYRDL